MKRILFIGQCKQGSNSLFYLLAKQTGLICGHNIRALVVADRNNQSYMDNWKDIDISNSKYIIDKSIINPDKYNYKIQDWENYNHKMIYMIRNIHKMLKSQFLVVLAGEESYQYNIPKFKKFWDVDNLNEDMVKEIMDYNKQKYTHYYNLINLPKDVFDFNKNIMFCTFEDFINDQNNQFERLESFLDIKLESKDYPELNSTQFEWYSENTSSYERNVKEFDKWKDFIYNYCINYEEWEKLCQLTNIDFITKYNIKQKY